LNEGQSIQLVQDVTDTASELKKEEVSMTDENVYPTNGVRNVNESTSKEADVLLMHQAKQNVKDKQIMLRHMVAYPIAWLGMGAFYWFILLGYQLSFPHPRWWRFNDVFSQIGEVMPYIPSEHLWIFADIHDVAEHYLRFNYIPRIWYVFIGVMLAWGGWIIIKAIKHVKIPNKKVKPDPVVQEYNRLKNKVDETAS